MKKFKIYILFTIALTLVYCNKIDDQPINDIIFQDINKTITLLNSDSIEGTCKDLIFEIKEIDQNHFTASIRL